MQVIFVSDYVMLISFFIVWPFFQVGGALICKMLTYEQLRKISSLLKAKSWEKNGEFYKRFFLIHKWKKFLPDGAALVKNDFRKKHLQNTNKDYIEKFVLETYRAELVHLFGIAPFFIFGFYCPFYIVLLMFFYAIIVNLPCILAQRYNRPRLERLINKSNKSSKPVL